MSVQKSGEAQLTGISSAVQSRINTLLSQTLYPFFFFNGERVEWMASADAYEEVEEGLKSLLDIKIYERSIHHLRNVVSRELTTELAKHGGEELKEAIGELERLDARNDALAEEEKRLATEIAALETERDVFERQQGELRDLAVLAQQRDNLREQHAMRREELSDRTAALRRVLSRDGYLALAEPELDSTRQAVSAARQRGELPAKIKPQFVEDLLTGKLCICGRALDEAHPGEVTTLKKWQQNTGLAEYEEAVSLTSAAVDALEVRRRAFFEAVDDHQGRRSSLQAMIRKLVDDMEEVDAKLGDPEAGEKAVRLAAQIEFINSNLIEKKSEALRTSRDQVENGDLRAGCDARIAKLQTLDQQGEVVRRRRNAVDRVATVLEEIYVIRKDDVRQDLSGRIARIWQDASIKDYQASLNDDFQLRLTKRVGGYEQQVHGASTGEKQVLALSFVGSLVEKTRDNLEESGKSEMEVERGGQYPLVMDSPFGSLEDDYRAKVAHWIPKLAGQVVVMVSKSQWREEVEREIRPRVGREYILELHTTKPDSTRTIDILDGSYAYVVETTDPYEKTQSRDVRR